MEKNYVVLSTYTDGSGFVDIFGPFTKQEAQEFAKKENEDALDTSGEEPYQIYLFVVHPMLTETTDFKARDFSKDGTNDEWVKAICFNCHAQEYGEPVDLNVGSGWHRRVLERPLGPEKFVYLCEECRSKGITF